MRITDIHAGYQKDLDILQGLSVDVRDRQLTTIIGANGVGKSTLLRCVIGQLKPHRGSIEHGGVDLTRVPTHRLVELGIAFVAQRHTLFSELTIEENLDLGCWSFRRDRVRRRAAIERTLERMPQFKDRRRTRAGSLSGGQQRLLEIERALMSNPGVLLVDEPTVGLDPKKCGIIYDHLRDLVSQGLSILMVDQNILAGIEYADYVYVVELGRNKIEGPKAEFVREYGATIENWLL